MFHLFKLNPGRKLWRHLLDRRSPLVASIVLLFVGFALAVAPVGCQLFCKDCCADDSQCPVCLLVRAHATLPDEPLRCEVFIFVQIAGRLASASRMLFEIVAPNASRVGACDGIDMKRIRFLRPYRASEVAPRKGTRTTSSCRPGPLTRRRGLMTLSITSVLCLSAWMLQAQETNEVELLKKQLQQVREQFEKAQQEYQRQIDALS
ncbi:MAG: hypothetical protein DME26_19625, partial [Verrucomicrobia bacterium]